MGKHKDILMKLAENKIEDSEGHLDEIEEKEEINEEYKYHKVQGAIDNYQDERKRVFKKYWSIIENELSEEELRALQDAKKDLLRNDLRRVQFLVRWVDIIDASQIESFIEEHI